VRNDARRGDGTFAPADTAFRIRTWHWERLWVMDAVEHICPIAWGRFQHSAFCWVVIAYCEHHIDEGRSVHCFDNLELNHTFKMRTKS
jgi:hypothetical protein